MEYNNMKIYNVDAFSSTPFSGNPAAVCVTQRQLDSSLMQKIAKEMNLSETAFVVPGEFSNEFCIRWFTPKLEVDLCGHATMAAAKVLFEKYPIDGDCIIFKYAKGDIKAYSINGMFKMDFPLDEVEEEVQCSKELLEALGIISYDKAVVGKNTRKLIIQLKTGEDVIALKPDFAMLQAVSFKNIVKGVGVTAPGTGRYDIITRYFNPWAGVNEDPVTGSVHTLLAAYWSEILGKDELLAYQASERGGEIHIKLADKGRVELGGQAVLISAGDLYV